METRFFELTLLIVLYALSQSGFAQETRSPLGDQGIERRVNAVLKQMTLEEKIGQLTQLSAGAATGPEGVRSNFGERAAKGAIGSLLNLTGAAETNALQKIAVEKSRLHIPLLFGLDVIHGYRTIFPVPLGMAATWDPAAVERASRIAAREATAQGVRWTFSPMVDIARDARWGRIVEGAGEDPYLGSAMASAYVRGYQGSKLDDPQSMAACAKHFVGYGAAEAGRDYNTVDMPERTLRQVYLPPFEAAERAGTLTFMSAFNALNGVPASANPFTLDQILRKEWGFRGLVVSDWGAIEELMAHGIANDGATAARKALLAGVDMDMESHLYEKHLPELVRSGALPMAAVDEAVRRVLRVKFALGLFDRPYVQERAEGDAKPYLDPTDVAFARKVAEESFILLKNSGSGGTATLPIGKDVKTVALIGPFGDDAAQMLGSWQGRGEAADAVTLLAALRDRMQQNGGRVLYAEGTEITGQSDAGFAEAVNAASQADVTIIALGEDAGLMTGEAASRAHLDLPGNQQQLLEAIAATGKPVVLVVFSGRPLVLGWAAEHVPAILEAWYPGIQAGPALVRVLFGDVSPSGRLTVSLPRSVGQEPLYYNALSTGRPPERIDLSHPPTNELEKYHSRYIDEPNTALFPFGYGLSYTQFSYSPVDLSVSQISAQALNSGQGGPLRIVATVKNDGNVPADEVVQLYIRLRGTSVARPVRELKGFQRISLAPGESKRVEFTLGRDELAFWNIDMKNVVEPAQVTVWIGPSSVEGQSAEFRISP